MTEYEKIKKARDEIQSEITEILKIDVKSYQIGVFEGLNIALEILKLSQYENN